MINSPESSKPVSPQNQTTLTPAEQLEFEGFESDMTTWEEIKARPPHPEGYSTSSFEEEVEALISDFHRKLDKKIFISWPELTDLIIKVRSLYMLSDVDESKRFVIEMRRTWADFDLSYRQKMEKMIEIINAVAARGIRRDD